MRVYRVETDGIPGWVCEPATPAGLLLLGHRGTHSKDDAFYVALGRRLASHCGLAVVCIDAPAHGERRPDSGDRAADDAAVLDAIVSGEDQAAHDWATVTSGLAGLGQPVAMVGFSMGALVALVTAPRLPSIRALVLVAGGIPAFAVRARRAPGSTTPQLRAAAALGDIDVSMLNTTSDEVCPPAGALELFEAIPGARKRMAFWEGDHDHVPAEMVETTIDVLRRALADEHGGRSTR